MAVDDVYEVRIEGIACSGERWNNVFHYRKSIETEVDEFESAEALAGTIYGIYKAEMMVLLGTNHFLDSSRCVKIYPNRGIPSVYTEVTATEGSAITESLPPDVAAVCTKRSKTGGGSGRGRAFISGIPEGAATLDQLNENDAIAIANAFHSMQNEPITSIDNNEWTPVIFSKKLAGEVPIPPSIFFDVWRVECDQTLRNMRSRGRPERRIVQGSQT